MDSPCSHAPHFPYPNRIQSPITIAAGLDTYGALNQHPSANQSYQVGVSLDQGLRPTMEDTFGFVVDFDAVRGQGLFGIFDGHGNQLAAEWCGANFHTHFRKYLRLLPNTSIPGILDAIYESMDQSLLGLSKDCPLMSASGCAAVTAFLRFEDGDGLQSFLPIPPAGPCNISSVSQGAASPPASAERVLYCANAGDARAVLCRGGRALRLTFDHKATDPSEVTRIKEAQGVIFKGRVYGSLNVTRSIGNHEIIDDSLSMKRFVISKPYTSVTRLSDEDEFLILACDGLWDVITDQEAVDIVRTIKDAQEASKVLLNRAFAKGSHDNVTVMVVRFRDVYDMPTPLATPPGFPHIYV